VSNSIVQLGKLGLKARSAIEGLYTSPVVLKKVREFEMVVNVGHGDVVAKGIVATGSWRGSKALREYLNQSATEGVMKANRVSIASNAVLGGNGKKIRGSEVKWLEYTSKSSSEINEINAANIRYTDPDKIKNLAKNSIAVLAFAGIGGAVLLK
jgi:hypothetical protein